jgi:WD40 repeat protein
MRNHSHAIILFLLVLPAISCSRGPKYSFPLIQKYTTQAGDVFYFRPRDGQFVLVERRKALAVAIASEPDIQAFSYDDYIDVSRPIREVHALEGQALESRTFLNKIAAQQALAISPDGRLLAGGDASGVVNIWNTTTAGLELQLNKASGILSMTFSPDGNFLAIGLAKPAGEPSDTVWLYDVRAHSAQRSFGLNAVPALAWSSDGRWCAAGLDDGSVLLAEAGADSEPRRITLSTSPVASLDFHPSGLFLASAHTDKRILVYKLPTAELIFTFEPSAPPNPSFPRVIERVAFDGTGGRLAADYAEGEMRIWDSSALAKSLAK